MYSLLPVSGVGLARLEFMIANHIKCHPMALVNYDSLSDDFGAKSRIDMLLSSHTGTPTDFFVNELSAGIGFIAAAFHPRPVVVRLSDFKTNEYARLLGGEPFEPKEENPMLGWRGASRYYDPKYRKGFALECAALKRAREHMGFTNIIPMVPFCRTVAEGKKVLDEMACNGLKRGENGLKIYVMCEIPSNCILFKQFAEIFDGFSIGSNDLTQLTLGVDRDSALVEGLFDERNEAVKALIRKVIKNARKMNFPVGICGQAPSDYPDFTEFLVSEGITSISLNPDSILKMILTVANLEKKL